MIVRTLIQFCRVKDDLPGITSGGVYNASSKKLEQFDWLSHTGPDGKTWAILWLDLQKLQRWATYRNRTFSTTLQELIEKYGIKTNKGEVD